LVANVEVAGSSQQVNTLEEEVALVNSLREARTEADIVLLNLELSAGARVISATERALTEPLYYVYRG
jgi:hypothetical protein